MKDQMLQQKLEFEDMTLQFGEIKEKADAAYLNSTEAMNRVEALEEELGDLTITADIPLIEY